MSTKYGGYMGKVALVDLTTGQKSEYPWSDEERKLFIGGKTMAAKIISDHLTEIKSPLDPSNLLVITTGPLTGTGAPSSSRFNISTISPLTGILTSSNCGGNFGYYLKKAGYDALIIAGRSEKPVWLAIHNDTFQLHEADSMWGMLTGHVQEHLDEKLSEQAKGRKVKNGKIVIGPAGENLVRYASVVSNERLAGRGGVGAVMGSKNLKAVTVSGNKTVQAKHPEKMLKLNQKWFKYLHGHPLTGDQMPRLGTAGLVSAMQFNGQLSTKNYKYGQYEDYEKVNGETLAEKYNIVNKGCLTCPIKCARTVEVNGKPVKGPELETLGLLGGGILNNDIELIFKWNYELDELGMDTISAANTLSYAMEANEQGLWDNGLEFGLTESISQIWDDIAHRRGIGDELAEGSRWLSEKYGGKDFAVHAKGMELAAYEPRRAVGLGLGYATSNRGGCHLNGGYMVIMEGLGLSMDAQTPHAKADGTVIFQDLMECISATGQCLFTSYAFFPFFLLKYPQAFWTKAVNKILPCAGPVMRIINKYPEIACIHLPIIFNQSKAMELATGMNMKFGTYIKAGKRGYVLERLINTKLGITAADDKLPKRFTDTPQVEGDERTKVPLEKMKKVYYDARGFDQNGLPKDKILKKLKLDNLAVAKMSPRPSLWEGPEAADTAAAGSTAKEVAPDGNH